MLAHSSTTVSTIITAPSVGLSLGRVAPTFSRPPPSADLPALAPTRTWTLPRPLPTFSKPGSPSTMSPSSSQSLQDSRRIRLPPSLVRPSGLSADLPVPAQRKCAFLRPLPTFSKPVSAPSSSQSTSNSLFATDDIVAADDWDFRGIRRSKINRPEQLLCLTEEGREEVDALPLADSAIVDFCELLLQERSNASLMRSLHANKEAAALIYLMIKGGMRAVQICDWADAADIDEYYLYTYARQVANMFPLGLITIKEGHFIPGAALAEYINLYRIIYSQELKVLLEKGEKMEKDLASSLGIESVQGLLSMDSVSPHFACYHVERRNEDRFISLRA